MRGGESRFVGLTFESDLRLPNVTLVGIPVGCLGFLRGLPLCKGNRLPFIKELFFHCIP